jgi:MFS family permease
VKRGLVGLLVAQAVSLTGTRLSMIALPWFVLVTSGSATRTGLVAFCEMAPYVLVKGLSGPVIDRVGAHRVSIGADAASAVVVGTIPLLYFAGVLPFGVLLALVAAAGAVRGPGDTAKGTLVPDVAAAAGLALERVTGMSGTVSRLAQTVGAMLAGAVVAWLGPLTALVADAASFAVAAVVIAATARGGAQPAAEADDGDGYLRRLRAGAGFIRREPLLRALIVMVAITNLIDAAVSPVLLPVWGRQHGGPVVIGTLFAVLGAAAVAGSLVATAVAHRLPRRATYLISFLIAGAPRIAVLALDVPLWAVIAVWGAAGLGVGFINPILGAVFYERIPRPLLGRVAALGDTVAFAGIPLGGLAAGALVTAVGLGPTLALCAGVYLLATALPVLLPEWREMDTRRPAAAVPEQQPVAGSVT